MYPEWGAVILGSAGFIWLAFLTFLVWQNNSIMGKGQRILGSVFEDEGSEVKLDQLIRKITGLGNQVEDLREQLNGLSADGVEHIQKTALVRYNPLHDTGGDQSFSIALLNGKNSGLVITSLHSRAGTRVFAKPVIEGKSEKYNFSEEEEEVIKKAISREIGSSV